MKNFFYKKLSCKHPIKRRDELLVHIESARKYMTSGLNYPEGNRIGEIIDDLSLANMSQP